MTDIFTGLTRRRTPYMDVLQSAQRVNVGRLRSVRAGQGGNFQVVGLAETIAMLRRSGHQAAVGLRKGILAGAEGVRDDARAGVRSWTTRSGYRRTGETERSVRVGLNQRGVYVVMGGIRHRRRPGGFVMGRLHEVGGRHPLFGDRTRWYPQPVRPTLRPAARRGAPRVKRIVENEMRQAMEAI